jgi:hypothetical protein
LSGFSFPDAVGMLGALLIVAAYFLLQTGRLAAHSVTFSLVNGLGAAAILFSLVFDFNLAAFAIEFFWLLISLYGLYRAFAGRASR